ncbi:hypothetical protein [Formosa haliotis]|uniref:hypothetical protein n=1 Tax=Formosa haliotis TaxID=1555194 RepID=UPI001146E264|nr:hypothetical protein [Formosa haliotis]
MKTATLFLALFLLLKPLIPLVEYAAFYDYIKNELCENKEIVEMKCNGKCYLAKEMAKVSDTPESGTSDKQTAFETTVVFYQNIVDTVFTPLFLDLNSEKIASNYNRSYAYLDQDAVFHPPKA